MAHQVIGWPHTAINGRAWVDEDIRQQDVFAVEASNGVSALNPRVMGACHNREAAALELALLRVNVLSPGGIGIRPDRNLVHHAGQPDDFALAAVMVMANPAMTGAVIDVDGGERLGTWSGFPA